jgi:CheY-like chemotaxis protein
MVKVLFIDDEPTAHKTLELILPDPYVLLSAYSARHGMEIVERDGPDVVLLDINLPDRDGIALLREIQARPCPPPVVMLTASPIGQRAFSLMRWAVYLRVSAVAAGGAERSSKEGTGI